MSSPFSFQKRASLSLSRDVIDYEALFNRRQTYQWLYQCRQGLCCHANLISAVHVIATGLLVGWLTGCLVMYMVGCIFGKLIVDLRKQRIRLGTPSSWLVK